LKTITWLSPADGPEWFPPVERALDEPSGLLAAGGDLRPERLLAAYRLGVFPWYSRGQPVLWWSPDPREVLLPREFRTTRSLAKTIRNKGFETQLDRDFAAVIAGCAAPRGAVRETWITPEMQAAYLRLHQLGHAHSVETWRCGALVGGLYGVQVGRIFFGESMWSAERDASKVALARLVGECLARGIELIDCQLASQHLKSLGSRSLPRHDFLALVREHAAANVADAWRAAEPL
jgi:leucyl/phenylalanyl-tRNA---protein transferase